MTMRVTKSMPLKTRTRTFTPRGTALEIFKRRDREVVVAGPAGTGKSRGCLEKVLMMCLSNPGMKGLILRKTAISLTSSTLATWENWVATEALARQDVSWYGGSAREPAAYRFRNGSRVEVAGLDKPEKIMSSEYDLIFVDECTELNVTDWEFCTTRLRNGRVSFQQLLAACNPQGPTHFLKLRSDEGRTVMLASRHQDNPRYFRPDGTMTEPGRQYMATLDALTGIRRLRLRDGIWAGAEGVIYDEFDPNLHIIDKMPYGWERWDRYWAIDFGTTNPFVLQCWAEDPDGRLYLYREIYMTKTMVEDHAKNIMSIVAPGTTWDDKGISKLAPWIEPKPKKVICDHDLGERMVIERYTGLRTEPAHKDVKPGIEAVQARYRRAADNKPRIFFLRGALVKRDPLLLTAKKPCDTVAEIPGYVWDERKDAPLKVDDHGQDAKRYLVAERDIVGGGVTKIRIPRRAGS